MEVSKKKKTFFTFILLKEKRYYFRFAIWQKKLTQALWNRLKPEWLFVFFCGGRQDIYIYESVRIMNMSSKTCKSLLNDLSRGFNPALMKTKAYFWDFNHQCIRDDLNESHWREVTETRSNEPDPIFNESLIYQPTTYFRPVSIYAEASKDDTCVNLRTRASPSLLLTG